jgi:hypothetical protein
MSQGRYVSGELVRSVYVVNMSSGGGSGTPGGSNTQIQFNNAGVFGGVANSSVNNATGNITLGNRVSVPLGTAALPSIYPGTDTNTGIYSPGADQLAVATNGTGRLFINATGNVGIGTTSPSEQLEVYSTSDHRLKVSRAATAIELVQPASASPMLNASGTGVALRFGINDAEGARLDASGRLLVGTSTALSTDSIFQVKSSNPANVIEISRRANDSSPARFNFSKTRGDATDIVLNNDTIGEILFRASDGVVATPIAAGISTHVDGTPGPNDMPGRLVFSTTADGASSPTERMRITSDAYVRLAAGTGGIQFNGDTAAANALDDYEDGTWTPIFVPQTGSFNSITYDSTRAGNYTKVGNLVTVWGIIRTDSVDATGASGLLSIGGLPFSVGTGTTGGGFAVNLLNWAGEYPSSVRPSVGETFAYLGYRTAIDGNDTISNVSDLTTGTGDANRLAFQFSYRV